MRERRKQSRRRIPTVPVRIGAGLQAHSLYGRDLSEGGIFIKTQRPLPLGEQLEVNLLSPRADAPVVLRGEVVRLEQDEHGATSGVGVAFLDLSGRARASIREILDHHGDPIASSARIETVEDEVSALRKHLRDADDCLFSVYTELETLERDFVRQAAGLEHVLEAYWTLAADVTTLVDAAVASPDCPEPLRSLATHLRAVVRTEPFDIEKQYT